jgi:hypothetical protein
MVMKRTLLIRDALIALIFLYSKMSRQRDLIVIWMVYVLLGIPWCRLYSSDSKPEYR